MSIEIVFHFITENIDGSIAVFIDNYAFTIRNGVVYVLAAHYLEEFIRAGEQRTNKANHGVSLNELKEQVCDRIVFTAIL
ncbi:hypothetical protein C7431_108132 [Pantoea allii]|uniref:Uncharacterized protein n=1 Tax=Pantoea allii TaxID=574096 RepID=A0A2V2BE13_9GAMM|nr:hypothetical protein [Pantoea allii]OAE06461.1 hypothetical protein A6A26_01875 [Pantoea sp. OXWO6B1]MBW1254220.1 hypothetical protein [Pantoea allii]MBW1258709.1 hypothetical protein [Pantoea allii]MBW1263392.1 hypothetical protein [Pantoea allii]